jgi:hypothetical protein
MGDGQVFAPLLLEADNLRKGNGKETMYEKASLAVWWESVLFLATRSIQTDKQHILNILVQAY